MMNFLWILFEKDKNKNMNLYFDKQICDSLNSNGLACLVVSSIIVGVVVCCMLLFCISVECGIKSCRARSRRRRNAEAFAMSSIGRRNVQHGLRMIGPQDTIVDLNNNFAHITV